MCVYIACVYYVCILCVVTVCGYCVGVCVGVVFKGKTTIATGMHDID